MNVVWSLLLLGALVTLARMLVRARAKDVSRTQRYEHHERANMPGELATGRLVLSEEYRRTDVPRRIGARVDQVYECDGVLVPVDTKTRKRRHWTRYDQIELSAQAVVLAHTERKKVARHGWIRLARRESAPVYLRVPLLGEDVVAGLYDRYMDLERGRLAPKGAQHPAMCNACAYRTKCKLAKEQGT